MTVLAWIGMMSPDSMSSAIIPLTWLLSMTNVTGRRSDLLFILRFMVCSSRVLVTSLTVLSPQPATLAILCPGSWERCGDPSADLLRTNPHLSSSARFSTADEHILVAASWFVVSPPAEMVSWMCEEAVVSFNEAARPDSGGCPEAAPTEDSETSRGFAPASDADMAALRAAGPSPSTKTSHDSMPIDYSTGKGVMNMTLGALGLILPIAQGNCYSPDCFSGFSHAHCGTFRINSGCQ